MIIYIVIVEDRHTDTECYPFDSVDAAIAFAKEEAADIGTPVEEAIDGWLYAARCSSEGDYVRVVEKTLNAGAEYPD